MLSGRGKGDLSGSAPFRTRVRGGPALLFGCAADPIKNAGWTLASVFLFWLRVDSESESGPEKLDQTLARLFLTSGGNAGDPPVVASTGG